MDGSCGFSQQMMCHVTQRGRAEYVRVIEMARSRTDLLLAGATAWKRQNTTKRTKNLAFLSS